MNIFTKSIIVVSVVLFAITTTKSLTASNQFESPDSINLDKITLIKNTLIEEEISLASFMNNDVSIVECQEIFKENNFKHFNYNYCLSFIEDLNITAIDHIEDSKNI